MKDIYKRAYQVIRANVSMYHQNRDWYVRQSELFPITGSHLQHATEIHKLNNKAFQCAMRSYREGHVITDEQPIIDIVCAVMKIS